MINLLDSAASLATNAARTQQDSAELQETKRARNIQALQTLTGQIADSIKTRVTEEGAMDRQKVVGQQQIDLEREKQRYQNIQITPQIANGLSQSLGDPAIKDLEGQTMPVERLLGFYTVAFKSKLKPYSFDEGDKTVTIYFDHEKGEWQRKEAPRDVRKTTPRGGGSGGNPKDKEFLKTYRQYMKDTEGFNYEMLKGLSTYDSKQSEDLKSKLDFIEANKGRFAKLNNVAPPPKTPAQPKPQLPDAAMKALKAKPGEVVTFANGQAWTMEQDGSVKRVR